MHWISSCDINKLTLSTTQLEIDGFVTLLERKSATNHTNEYKSNRYRRLFQED